MSSRRRQFLRPFGERRYRKLFVIAVEGAKTEPDYFSQLERMLQSVVQLKPLKDRYDSSPLQVLKRMASYIRAESLKKTDEAWRDCIDHLRRHLPDYDKGIAPRMITKERIEEAIRRAKSRDNPRCTDWPRTFGSTTVYRLVESILGACRNTLKLRPT